MNDFKSIYFVGAGGIGMAALVRYYLSKGYKVAGYDRAKTALTEQLEAEGAAIYYNESVNDIPDYCKDKETTLVVYTPAIPDAHEGLQFFRNGGFQIMKRAQLLGFITRDSKGLCFSGTHGKTTTSSMAAHILHSSEIGCNAFLGGILRNYDSNLILNKDSQYTVIEADEYDRSFHQLSPYIAVVTATDPDHLDIYGTEEAYLESFAHFTSLIKDDGALIVHTGLKLKPRVSPHVKQYSYSRNEGDFHAENIRKANGEIIFDFVHPDGIVTDVSLGVPVDINIENAIAAMAVCILVDVKPEILRSAICSYMGTKRRFEFWIKEPGATGKVMIDDYAHHPDELKASIASVKSLYPNRKLSVIFQPHLFTRTRDFAPQFGEALSLADEVLLLDIYPARELPIPGVTSEIIFNDIKCPIKALCEKKDLIDTVKRYNFDILLTVGAGDISNYLEKICEIIKMKH